MTFSFFRIPFLIVVVGFEILSSDAFVHERTRVSHRLTKLVYTPVVSNPQSVTALSEKKGSKFPPGKIVAKTEYLQILTDGSDAWRTMDVATILQNGGIGVMPTDTGYGFVTMLESKAGLERMLRIKGVHTCKKPLSLLCSDLSTVDKYCYGISRGVFKVLKKNLPGPYTFILPASTALPKMLFFDGKGGKHSWARKSVGVRTPNDPVLRYLQDELLDGAPLLVSSLPVDEEDGVQQLYCNLDPDSVWCNDVDFVVDAGERPVDGSTVYDFTGGRRSL